MTNDDTPIRPDGADDDRPGQEHDLESDAATRPTSPARSAASEAAARAAYAEAGKAQPAGDPADAPQPTADDGDLGVDIPDTPEELFTEQAPAAPQGGDDARLAAERLADYQRLNAEYVNYKRRVDRERAEDRNRALSSFVESLLPVLDEIHLAREHGDLGDDTPFAKIAGKLEDILGRHGVERFGEVGETFDPTVHEALMHTTADLPAGTTDTTVVMVMQPGYRIGERVVRPARVSVADPA